MKIFIDNQRVEVKDETSLRVSFDLEEKLELLADDDSEYLRFELPITAQNIAVMGDPEQPLSTTMFNQTDHEAYIEQEGAKVVWGRAFLAECQVNEDSSGYFVVAIRPYAKEWEETADDTLLRESPFEYSATFGGGTIALSWTGDDQLIRYLPVHNDTDAISQGGTVIVDMLTTMDYYPFVHMATFFRKVAEQEGYTIESDFIDSDYFESLYFSGYYNNRDCDSYIEKMDFLAGRLTAGETTASSAGIVYADPYRTSNSIGNIVDVIDPVSEVGGVTVADAFSNGGCFNVSGTAVTFTPTSELNMAFEYDIAYLTDYYIESRAKLQCIDTMTLHDGTEFAFDVACPFSDYRQMASLTRSFTYRVIVFDTTYAASYMLTCDTSAGTTDYTLATFTDRTATFTSAASVDYSNLKLWINAGSGYEICEDDWAVYESAFDERGSVNITLTVRSNPTLYEAGEPVYFRGITFSGAESGASFELSQKVTLKPLFLLHPALGAELEWEDVVAHPGYYQMDIISAVAQMYDLQFYTDPYSKKILIEPYSKIVESGNVVDLSSRADNSQPTTVAEMGHDISNRMELEYSSGDGYVASWNVANNESLGYWSAEIENKFSKNSLQREADVMFTPSLSPTDIMRYAASARVLQVGPRGSYGTQRDYSEDLNFPIKVVRYLGMKDLEAGEMWGWPSYGTSYPFVGFYHGGDVGYNGLADVNPASVESTGDDAFDSGFSLCFEDRDKVAGLHMYHDHRVDVYNKSKKITQYIFLEPHEIEQIVLPNSQKKDWRALYKIKVMGEEVLCRLLSIENYNPTKRTSTKCVFIKEV